MAGKRRTTAKRSATKTAPQAQGFDAGKMGRRLKAIPASRTAINTLIRAYGKNVLARSRYLCANNAYAASAKEEFIAYMIGTGITPSWQIKGDTKGELKSAIQQVFSQFADECDADAITDFYGLQGLAAAELFEAGECFIRLRKRYAEDGFTVPLQLQLLPSEMLPTDYNIVLPAGRRIECGIQFDAIGRREGYWFYVMHPGENFLIVDATKVANFMKVFVPANEVIHLYRPLRAGQIRGVPMTLAGMTVLAGLDLYDDAELERKRIAALFGAFVTKGLTQTDDDDANPLYSGPNSPHKLASTQVDFALEPGATVELDYGQDIKFAEPADVGGNYEAFQKRQLLRASAGMLTTYHGMTGDTGASSFSSMRADQLRYRRRVEPMQYHIIIHQFCRRVAIEFMNVAVQALAIDGLSAATYAKEPKAYQQVKWTPPKWDWVDPLKDITAEKLAVDSGFKSRDAVIEAQGEDPALVDDSIEAAQTRAADKKLKFITTRTGVLVSPTSDDLELASSQDPTGAANPQDNPQPGKGGKVVPLKGGNK